MNGTRTVARLVCGIMPVLLLLLAPAAFSQDSLGISIIRGQQTYNYFNDVAVLGDYLAVAAGTSGLLIIEEDDGEFTVVNQLQTLGENIGVIEVSGDIALTMGTTAMMLYSIEDPLHPVQTASYAYSDMFYRFSNADIYQVRKICLMDTVLIKEESRGIIFCSITDQHAPALLDSFYFDPGIYSIQQVEITPSLVAVSICADTLGNLDFALLDYSNPLAVQAVELPEDFDRQVENFDINDGRLLVKREQTLSLYNLANPNEIQLLDEWTADSVDSLGSITLLDDYVLARFSGSYFRQFDISNDELEPLYTLPADDFLGPWRHKSDNHAWFAGAQYGLLSYDLQAEAPGIIAGKYDPVYDLRTPVLLGETIVIGSSSDSLRFYRHSNADELTLLGTWLPEGAIGARVRSVGDEQALIQFTYPHHGPASTFTVQVITPNPDAELGVDFRDTLQTPVLQFFETYDDVLVGYDNLYDYDEEASHFCFYDMSDPDNLSLLNTVRMDFHVFNIPVCYNNHLYLTSSQGIGTRFRIVDFSDPSTPEVVLDEAADDWAHHFTRTGNDLFLLQDWHTANNNEEYGVYSLSDPSLPVLHHEIELPLSVNIFDRRGDYLLLNRHETNYDTRKHIEIHSLNEWTEDPTMIACYTLPDYGLAMFLEDNRLFACWGYGWGLFSCDDVGVGGQDIEPLPVAPELAMYPNPANPETRITLELPQTEAVTVCVYDVLGREVARLHEGVLQAGNHAFHFGSQPGLASGVYFVHATAGQWETAQRIVLLK